MNDNDQNIKTLLTEFLPQFFELFLPEWRSKFDFDSLEWQQQELFPDPPDGERRVVDLLGRLRTQQPLVFDGRRSDEWLTLLHIEIEGRDSVTETGCRMHRYYSGLRDRHALPVLPIVLFLHVGLEGIGVATYKEDYGFSTEPDESSNLDVLRFRYPYVGLRGLDAIEYLQRGSELGVALSSLMKVPSDRRVWFKAEALQRIAISQLTDRLKELLCRFVEIYISLEPEEESEFDRLVAAEPYEEARTMGTTFFERGVEKGLEDGIKRGIQKGIEKGRKEGLAAGKQTAQCQMLTRQIERRFGSLTASQKKRLAALSVARRSELIDLVLTAESLAEFGLGE